jgi:hypothetical protein
VNIRYLEGFLRDPWRSSRLRSLRVQNDSITLSLTKEQVGQLDVRRVHRWF